MLVLRVFFCLCWDEGELLVMKFCVLGFEEELPCWFRGKFVCLWWILGGMCARLGSKMSFLVGVRDVCPC